MKYILAIIIVITSSNLYSEVIYKTIPGTNIKDITEPLMIIDKGGIYPTLPGTTLRDYSVMPEFVIE